MNPLVKSARVLGQILSAVIGDGFTTLTDEALRDHLDVGLYI